MKNVRTRFGLLVAFLAAVCSEKASNAAVQELVEEGKTYQWGHDALLKKMFERDIKKMKEEASLVVSQPSK